MTEKLPALPESIKTSVRSARLPLNYEAAKNAIVQCDRIDECKEWSDKSQAIASYARQVQDNTLKDSANRIKLRARARIGELLNEIPWRRGRGSNSETRRAVGAQHGLSRHMVEECSAIARIDPETRDQLIEQTPPPTSKQITRASSSKKYYPKNRFVASDNYRHLSAALANMIRAQRRYSPTDYAPYMSSDEAERLRTMLHEVIAWADDFERLLPKDNPESRGGGAT